MNRDVAHFDVKYVQVLDENGAVDSSNMPDLSDDQLKEIYWFMCLSREFDKVMLNLQREGRLGTFASIEGQEACNVASCYALEQKDWLFPAFRENGGMITRGVTLLQILLYWGGDEIGSKVDPDQNTFPVAIPIASQVVHAVGRGIASNIKNEDVISMTFLGDGGTSEGEFHEAMNMATVFNAKTVIICQNNGWAISTPRDHQTKSKTIAQKAIAYGMDGIQVDGNDALAVYKVVKDAVEKARRGEGPTFIECLTFRMGNHTTADDWTRYREKDLVESWRQKDPIVRLKNYLVKKGAWGDELDAKMYAEIKKKIDTAVTEFESYPKREPLDIFEHLYAKKDIHLNEQVEELKEYLKRRED